MSKIEILRAFPSESSFAFDRLGDSHCPARQPVLITERTNASDLPPTSAASALPISLHQFDDNIFPAFPV